MPLPDNPGLNTKVPHTIVFKMDESDPTPRRRMASMKTACKYGGFAKTKCYELIHEGRIRAYKLGSKTLIDLASIDELHASLPQLGVNRCGVEREKGVTGNHLSTQQKMVGGCGN